MDKFCVIFCNVSERSFMARFTETTSVDFETIAESLISLVSSLIAEKISPLFQSNAK